MRCIALSLLLIRFAEANHGSGMAPKRQRITLHKPKTRFPPRAGAFSDAPPPPPSYDLAGDDSNNNNIPYDHETVQERVDTWRRNQQDMYSHMTPEQASSPRDLQGRIKLVTTVSKGSRALIFFILMWRDVHLYEVADQARKGFVRLLLVVPLMALFLGNLAGVVASVTSPSHSAKKRMKAILNLNKLVEVLLIVYNFLRLTLMPSKLTPREVYIANTLHSVFFLLQSQAFTRLTWDEATASGSAVSSAGPPGAYSGYYGATEYAARDAYEEQQRPDGLSRSNGPGRPSRDGSWSY